MDRVIQRQDDMDSNEEEISINRSSITENQNEQDTGSKILSNIKTTSFLCLSFSMDKFIK
jgi:hypothetical protein